MQNLAFLRTALSGSMAATMTEFGFAVIIAGVLTLIFTVGLRRPGPWTAWWTFFLLVLLVAWASALWIVPVGPVLVGMYWIPVVLAALLAALLLASGSPTGRPGPHVQTHSEAELQEKAASRAVNVLFWALVILLLVVVVLGYLFGIRPAPPAG